MPHSTKSAKHNCFVYYTVNKKHSTTIPWHSLISGRLILINHIANRVKHYFQNRFYRRHELIIRGTHFASRFDFASGKHVMVVSHEMMHVCSFIWTRIMCKRRRIVCLNDFIVICVVSAVLPLRVIAFSRSFDSEHEYSIETVPIHSVCTWTYFVWFDFSWITEHGWCQGYE